MKTTVIPIGMLAFALGSILAGPIDFYSITRVRQYQQALDSEPVPTARSYFGEASLEPASLLEAASLQTPTGNEISFETGLFRAALSYNTKTTNALNLVIPTGTFTFILELEEGLTSTSDLTLAGDFPEPIRVQALTNLLELTATNLLQLAWSLGSSGTTNDVIEVQLFDTNQVSVFRSPTISGGHSLDGTATQVLIPANTLKSDESYEGSVRFLKVSDRETRKFGGARGIAGVGTETRFPLRTRPSTVVPEIPTTVRIVSIANDGAVEMELTGPGNRRLALESSTDLQNWNSIRQVETSPSGIATVSDARAAVTTRFYRAKTD